MERAFELLAASGAVPVVVIDDPDRAVPLAQALSRGGLPVIEITFRTDAAAESIRRVRAAMPDMLVGAGTVLNREQADAAAAAGAAFLVAPGFNPDMADHAASLGLPFMPGVNTPTHIELAIAKGLSMAKYFPAEASGGLAYLETIFGPYSHIPFAFMATGGVHADNCAPYLASPLIAACGGTWIASRQAIAAGRFSEIADNAARASKAVAEARGAGDGRSPRGPRG